MLGIKGCCGCLHILRWTHRCGNTRIVVRLRPKSVRRRRTLGSTVHAEVVVIRWIVLLRIRGVDWGRHHMRCYCLSLSCLIHTHLAATMVEHHQHILCLGWQLVLLEVIDTCGTSGVTHRKTLRYLVLDTDLEAVEYPRRMLNSKDCLSTSGILDKCECRGDNSYGNQCSFPCSHNCE